MSEWNRDLERIKVLPRRLAERAGIEETQVPVIIGDDVEPCRRLVQVKIGRIADREGRHAGRRALEPGHDGWPAAENGVLELIADKGPHHAAIEQGLAADFEAHAGRAG